MWRKKGGVLVWAPQAWKSRVEGENRREEKGFCERGAPEKPRLCVGSREDAFEPGGP